MADEGPPEEEEEVEEVELRYPVPPDIGDKMKAAFPYFLRKGGHKTQIPDKWVPLPQTCSFSYVCSLHIANSLLWLIVTKMHFLLYVCNKNSHDRWQLEQHIIYEQH